MSSSPNIVASLAAHPFLEGLDPASIEKLASMAFEVSFEPDQIIFREADASSFFYLLLTGSVSIEIKAPGKVVRIQTVGAGEELGWSSLLSNVSKQFQARSLEHVTALAFDGARVMAACEEDPNFGFQLLRRILSVVAERLQATRLQVLDVYAKKGGALR